MTQDDDPDHVDNRPHDDEGQEEGGWGGADLRRRPPPRTVRQRRQVFEFDPALLSDLSADVAARDAEWRRVFEHFDPRLREFFTYQRPDPDDLDDLLLHVWRAALRGFGALESPRAAWSYLLTVGKNYLRDQWVAETRQDRKLDFYTRHLAVEEEIRLQMPTVLERLAQEDPWAEGRWPVDPADFQERMAQLSDADRELILLRHVRDLTHEQAARELGISPAAARKRYSRILKHLREES